MKSISSVHCFKYKSCEADVYCSDGICSIQAINSKNQGEGHASQVMTIIEKFARKNGYNEIWVPTVLHSGFSIHLLKRGYEYKCLGVHPKIQEEVWGYVKRLSEQDKSRETSC